MSEYTQSLGWADVVRGMTVELRCDNYPSVVGEVEECALSRWVILKNAWYYKDRGWSLWVKPEPVEPDPLAELLAEARYPNGFRAGGTSNPVEATYDEQAATVRAAGYMTEAEWETKRTQPDGPPLRWRNGDGPWGELTRSTARGQSLSTLSGKRNGRSAELPQINPANVVQYSESFVQGRQVGWEDARRYLASTPEGSKP